MSIRTTARTTPTRSAQPSAATIALAVASTPIASALAILAMVGAIGLGVTSLDAQAATATPTIDQTVQVGAQTDRVTVTRDDHVRFVTPQGSFVVQFTGDQHVVNLQTVAPAGVLTHPVSVHVLPDGGDVYE